MKMRSPIKTLEQQLFISDMALLVGQIFLENDKMGAAGLAARTALTSLIGYADNLKGNLFQDVSGEWVVVAYCPHWECETKLSSFDELLSGVDGSYDSAEVGLSLVEILRKHADRIEAETNGKPS